MNIHAAILEALLSLRQTDEQLDAAKRLRAAHAIKRAAQSEASWLQKDEELAFAEQQCTALLVQQVKFILTAVEDQQNSLTDLSRRGAR